MYRSRRIPTPYGYTIRAIYNMICSITDAPLQVSSTYQLSTINILLRESDFHFIGPMQRE